MWTTERNRFLVAETTSLEPGTALDLGAGEGRNAMWLTGWLGDGGRRLRRRPHPRAGALDLVAVLYLHLTVAVYCDVHRKAADVLFSPDDLAGDLAGFSLVVERADRAQRTVTTADGERTAIGALIPARRQVDR